MLILISLSLVLHLAALACLLILLRGRSAPVGQESLEPVLREEFGKARAEADDHARNLRTELATAGAQSTETLTKLLLGQLKELHESNDRDFKQLQEAVTGAQKAGAAHLTEVLDKIGEAQNKRFGVFATQLTTLTESNEKHIGDLGKEVQNNLKEMREGNEQKLEQMRQTVDEKLQGTLEKRLGESFERVVNQLAEVHKGLGEMKELATGVGDLKRVLTNVKARGTWGEVQLGALLEQVLTPQQYERDVNPVPGSDNVVEFAIKLPGPDDGTRSVVWLPIDAKFPQADYNRLIDASESESGDPKAMKKAVGNFARTVKKEATSIRDKYLSPPHTTDFGIMFLPTEGLYAEVVRNQGLLDDLQQVQRIIPAGPTTLVAILNSLRMGFRTLAIQKRSSELWEVLSVVKTKFGEFRKDLSTLHGHLKNATQKIEETQEQTGEMLNTLEGAEEVPLDADSTKLSGIPSSDQPPLIGAEQ